MKLVINYFFLQKHENTVIMKGDDLPFHSRTLIHWLGLNFKANVAQSRRRKYKQHESALTCHPLKQQHLFEIYNNHGFD